MSANVETMFSVREKPWHGLGTIVQDAPTSKEARKNDFKGLVYGERSFFVTADDGKQYPVNEPDCIQ